MKQESTHSILKGIKDLIHPDENKGIVKHEATPTKQKTQNQIQNPLEAKNLPTSKSKAGLLAKENSPLNKIIGTSRDPRKSSSLRGGLRGTPNLTQQPIKISKNLRH